MTDKAPQYCQQCRKKGVIATVNGPTCTHTPFDWNKHLERMDKALGRTRDRFNPNGK